MNKFKEFIKKHKIPTLVISLLVLVGAIFLIGRSLASTTTGYLTNQTVDGLSFENADLVYENGITTFTVEVYNENQKAYSLKNISINLTDEDNNVTTLVGYIGETLETDEGKFMRASIDEDLSTSVKLEYQINK